MDFDFDGRFLIFDDFCLEIIAAVLNETLQTYVPGVQTNVPGTYTNTIKYIYVYTITHIYPLVRRELRS